MDIRQNKIVYEIITDELDARFSKVKPETESQRNVMFEGFLARQRTMLQLLEQDRHELVRYIMRNDWQDGFPRTLELLEGYGHLKVIDL